jgi:hypothetical protein
VLGYHYFFELLDGVLLRLKSIVDHNKVEVVNLQQFEDALCLVIGETGDVEGQSGEFFVVEADNVGLHVELLPMIEFLLLALLHPVVDRPDARIFLYDRHTNPVLQRLTVGGILSLNGYTVLTGSTNLSGKSPPVRLSTSLSVTYDLRLKGWVFLLGMCGRYFHTSSLISNKYRALKCHKYTLPSTLPRRMI